MTKMPYPSLNTYTNSYVYPQIHKQNFIYEQTNHLYLWQHYDEAKKLTLVSKVLTSATDSNKHKLSQESTTSLSRSPYQKPTYQKEQPQIHISFEARVNKSYHLQSFPKIHISYHHSIKQTHDILHIPIFTIKSN